MCAKACLRQDGYAKAHGINAGRLEVGLYGSVPQVTLRGVKAIGHRDMRREDAGQIHLDALLHLQAASWKVEPGKPCCRLDRFWRGESFWDGGDGLE